MEKNSNKSSCKMKLVICIFISALFISFVYSVDVGALVANSVGYINHYNGDHQYIDNSIWTYVCSDDSKCTKQKAVEGEEVSTLETCNMICAELQLWPKPTKIQLRPNSTSTFNKNQIIVHLNATDDVKADLNNATNIFMSTLPNAEESWTDEVDISSFKIDVEVSGDDRKLQIGTDESYNLSVTNIDDTIIVSISAPTYFGARNGLETLSQLIWLDSTVKKLKILHDVQISDLPKFSHRGLMVDTARNFFPMEQLKKVVDGMAASKLNVFHLHLTDSVSFPIVLPNNPVFAEYGAYSPEMVYTPDAIKELIEYARIRGIRVVLEIDAPSHANEGWNQKADNLVICGKDNIFNGHLNPENNETLDVLESVYKDLIELGTDSEMFHIGGDEVNLTCWAEVLPSIPFRSYRTEMHSYWANFTNKIFDTVKSANDNKLPKYIVLWSSPLTDSYIDKLNYKDNVVVQYWYGSVNGILENGHKVIFSTVGRWYLDCGFGPWKPSQTNGVCDPYTSWQTFYKYRPWEEYSSYAEQFLGGEACLWTEQVGTDSLETRIWPRAAALAERLWSDIDSFDSYDVFTRFDVHNERLRKRGLKTASIWPRWCSLNPGKC